MSNDPSDGCDCDDGRENEDTGPRLSPGRNAADTESLSLDSLFDLFSDRRTRYVLAHFESVSTDVLELDDLADRIVDYETDAGLGDGSEEHRAEVAVALHHKHLPKLSDTVIVDYDARSKTVRYWSDGRVSKCLELFEAERP